MFDVDPRESGSVWIGPPKWWKESAAEKGPRAWRDWSDRPRRRWAEDGPRRLRKFGRSGPLKLAEVGRSLVAEVCPKVPFLKIIYHYLINIVARGSLSHFRHALLRKLRYS